MKRNKTSYLFYSPSLLKPVTYDTHNATQFSWLQGLSLLMLVVAHVVRILYSLKQRWGAATEVWWHHFFLTGGLISGLFARGVIITQHLRQESHGTVMSSAVIRVLVVVMLVHCAAGSLRPLNKTLLVFLVSLCFSYCDLKLCHEHVV